MNALTTRLTTPPMLAMATWMNGIIVGSSSPCDEPMLTAILPPWLTMLLRKPCATTPTASGSATVLKRLVTTRKAKPQASAADHTPPAGGAPGGPGTNGPPGGGEKPGG